MNFIKRFSLMIGLLWVGNLWSQGTFTPTIADLSFPRTLLDANQIETVRASLNDSFKITLYERIWERAHDAIPEDNTTPANRTRRGIIAREAAFILLMDRKWVDSELVELSDTEREWLIERILFLLRTLNAEVETQAGWLFFDTWQFRSKELIHYLIAYDLLKGTGLVHPDLAEAQDALQTFAGNLHQRMVDDYINPITGLKNLRFFFYNPNNHGVMSAAAIGLAAIVLGDLDSEQPNYQPQNWINTAMWNLDYVLWRADGLIPRVSEPDLLAGYAEGPSYFWYGFQNAFAFFRALWNYLPDGTYPYTFDGDSRSIPHPWYDQRYHRLYEWMNRIRMPNGMSPTIHDTPHGFSTAITALSGWPQYNLPNPGLSYTSAWMASQYLA
ncbi:MAG: hypothetical protein AAGD05_10570, partial [Bacteroidota bacterium]